MPRGVVLPIAQRSQIKECTAGKKTVSPVGQFLWPEALAALDDLVEVKVVLDGDELMGKETVCMENSFLEKLWRCPIRGENWFLSVPSAGRATLMLKRPAWL